MPGRKTKARAAYVALELGPGEQASVLVKLEGVDVAGRRHAPDETVGQTAAASARLCSGFNN